MNQTDLISFLLHHWILVTLILILIIVIASYERLFGIGQSSGISPQEAINLINREDAVVVDVRNKDLFKKGHIINSLHVPASALDKHLNKLNAHKDKPIIVVCSQGQQATKVAELIGKQSFDKVKVLKGGLQAWREASLPLEKE